MTGVDAVAVRPVYKGFQPLASCHFQGMANILAAQGLEHADRKVCPSWGFRWDGRSPVLRRGDRWMEVLNATYGLRVRRYDFDNWEEADAVERDLAGEGLPFVAEIDAFEVPSEYKGREHVAHTVVVLARDEGGAKILDPMNHPEPAMVGAERYARMRRHPCVDRHHLYVSPEPPRHRPSAGEIATHFAASLERHWAADLRTLDAYREWLTERGAMADVARVGGERLYLAGFFSFLAELDPALGEASKSFLSLSRRWYLAHSLAISAASWARSHEGRLVRLLADLEEREARLHAEVWPVLSRVADRRNAISEG